MILIVIVIVRKAWVIGIVIVVWSSIRVIKGIRINDREGDSDKNNGSNRDKDIYK